ncbi:MAG: hypothetical protein AAF654_10165 [Myxococcota bacterium]
MSARLAVTHVEAMTATVTGTGVVVPDVSLGGGRARPEILLEIIRQARESGVLIAAPGRLAGLDGELQLMRPRVWSDNT